MAFGSLAPTDQRNLDAGYPQRKLAQGPNLIEQFHLGENENVDGKNSSVAELEHDALSEHMERLPSIFTARNVASSANQNEYQQQGSEEEYGIYQEEDFEGESGSEAGQRGRGYRN